MLKKSIHFVLLLSLLVLTGCGSGNYAVSGKVVFSDDGSPVSTGTVAFEAGSHLFRGLIQPDGTFVMGTQRANDGVPSGKYRVYVLAEKVTSTPTGDKTSEGEEEVLIEVEQLVDEKFTKSSTSGIEIDITGPKKDLEIKVDRYKPGTR